MECLDRRSTTGCVHCSKQRNWDCRSIFCCSSLHGGSQRAYPSRGVIEMTIRYSKASEGVALLCDPFGGLIEVKTVTCGHCQRIMHVSMYGDGTGDVELPKGSEHSLAPVKREQIGRASCRERGKKSV